MHKTSVHLDTLSRAYNPATSPPKIARGPHAPTPTTAITSKLKSKVIHREMCGKCDPLDLVFRLEKRFGVEISQAEGMAVLFHTAGTLHRHLVAKLRGECHKVPEIEPLFTEVCGAVNGITKWWGLTLSLSTDLNRRFAPANRAANWRALEEALGMSLPQLEHTTDEPFPSIPRNCSSIMGLTYWIAEHHPERVEWVPVSCERTGELAEHQLSEDEVWEALCECICDALGVDPEEVTYDARMVEDLGMD